MYRKTLIAELLRKCIEKYLKIKSPKKHLFNRYLFFLNMRDKVRKFSAAEKILK